MRAPRPLARRGAPPGATSTTRRTHSGLATTGGIISTTGVGGLTLGGGIGYLTRGFGLSLDNLLAADVVTADGQLLARERGENDDLFWALRGGGGNFGVVTSFEFQLHPVKDIYGGPMFFELSEAADVLEFYRDYIADAPEEMGVFPAFQIAPPLPFIPEDRHGDTFIALVGVLGRARSSRRGGVQAVPRRGAGRRGVRRADALPGAQQRVRRAVPAGACSTTGRRASRRSSRTRPSRRTWSTAPRCPA